MTKHFRSSESNHTKLEPSVEQVEAAWRKFVLAWDRSERTKAIADGVAAGHAKREFLALFLTDGSSQ
jgi:hypothetical protein